MADAEEKVSGDDRIWNSLGMMSCFVSIGTVIFQTAVNRLGTKIVTAHIAARRIEELTNVPMLCTGMAMTTYASQNLGAGEYDRIKRESIRHL